MDDYQEFLANVIRLGIEGAKQDYAGPDANPSANREGMLRGSVDGFEACMGCDPESLLWLRGDAAERRRQAKALGDAGDLREGAVWEAICFDEEVAWVINCVGAWQILHGQRPMGMVTRGGLIQARRVLGLL